MAAKIPFTASDPTMTPTEAMPNVAIQKYSAGPKNSVTRASSGPMVISATALAIPPIADDQQATFSALDASPRSAIGKPSKVVAIDAGVPGIRSRIAGIAPPYIDPL
jgi:hypothetical protein